MLTAPRPLGRGFYTLTKRTRVLICTDCGFRDDKDNIPLYWAIKELSTLKDGASNKE